MPVVKVRDIAWARLRSPDLEGRRSSCLDFGMVRAARTKDALYMRGTDPPHHLHVTELGEPRYVGIAYHAGERGRPRRLAQSRGRLGGRGHRRARRRQARAPARPDGYQVEVVYGMRDARRRSR